MQYAVQTVRDDELPRGVHVVIVERDQAPNLMLINGPHARAWVMMRSYENSLEPCTVPSVLRLAV